MSIFTVSVNIMLIFCEQAHQPITMVVATSDRLQDVALGKLLSSTSTATTTTSINNHHHHHSNNSNNTD